MFVDCKTYQITEAANGWVLKRMYVVEKKGFGTLHRESYYVAYNLEDLAKVIEEVSKLSHLEPYPETIK